MLEPYREAILAVIERNPRLTLEGLQSQMQGCLQTLWNALRRWGIVLKKVLRAVEQQRPDVQQRRRWWDILMSGQSVSRLVFLDETGASTKMARRDGWGPRSERVVSIVPHGH